METIVEQLYNKYGQSETKQIEEMIRIGAEVGNLKKVLTQKQYTQVLRISDNANKVIQKMSMMNFESGLRFCIKFMAEIYAINNNDYEPNSQNSPCQG